MLRIIIFKGHVPMIESLDYVNFCNYVTILQPLQYLVTPVAYWFSLYTDTTLSAVHSNSILEIV